MRRGCTSSKELAIYDTINIDARFTIQHKLGSGGMGQVYLAVDSETGKDVAIKVATVNNQIAKRRFSREIEILSGVHHESIVGYVSSGFTDDIYWYAMDYIPGPNVTEWFRSQGILDYSFLATTMGCIASALSVVHNQGVVHRDVKPENILMKGSLPVIVDFGIVHLQSASQASRLTHQGSIVGTAMYMSPEQVMGSLIDGRSDIYSLGTVLYEILTSQHPHPAESLPKLILKILQERPIRPTIHDPNIPKALEQITLSLLEKNPDLRYDTAEQLEEALTTFAHGGELTKLTRQSPMKAYESKRIPLVGRTDELEKLNSLLFSVNQKNGGVVVISGEPDIGKSRLLSEFKIMVLGDIGNYFECHAVPEDSVRPAISSVLDQLADYEIACNYDLINAHPHMIRSLSPKLANAMGIPGNPPNIADDDLIPEVVSQILCESFPEMPVVYAFDDGIDNTTKSVAYSCAKRTRESKTIVCCLSELGIPVYLNRIQNITHLHLEPLNRDDLNRLANAAIGRKLSAEEMERFEIYTEGKPGYAIQVFSSLKPNDKTLSITSVSDIRSLYQQRIEELDPPAKNILHVLSLFNRPIPPALLQPISRLSGTLFQGAFDALERNNLIQVSNIGMDLTCGVVSNDVKEVVNDTLSGDNTADLYRMIANTLSIYYSNSEDPDILAMISRHYLLAGESSKSCVFIIKALRLLEESGSFARGFHYVKILEENIDAVDSGLIHKVLQWIIRANAESGDLSKFEEWVTRSNEIIKNHPIDDISKSKVYLNISDGYSLFNNIPQAVAYVQKASVNKFLFDNELKLRLASVKAGIFMYQLDLDELKVVINEIEELITRIGNVESSSLDQIAYYSYKGVYLFEKGNRDEAIGAFKTALQISKEINHRKNMFRAMSNLGNAYHREGNYEKSLNYRNQAYELAKDMGLVQIQLKLIGALLSTYAKVGDVVRLRKKMLEFKGVLDSVPLSNHHIAWVSHYTQLTCLEGRFDDATEMIQHFKKQTIEKNQPHLLRDLLKFEAFQCFFSGNLKRALNMFDQINSAYELAENENIKLKHMNIKLAMVGLIDMLDLDIKRAEKLFLEAVELQKEFNSEHNRYEIMFANARINYMKSLRSTAFGATHFVSSPWRIAYNNLLEVQQFIERDECIVTMLQTYSTELFAQLVLRRMKYDRNLDSIEKRQIFDQAVASVEWLIKRYKTYGFKLLRDEIIGINNELIIEMGR